MKRVALCAIGVASMIGATPQSPLSLFHFPQKAPPCIGAQGGLDSLLGNLLFLKQILHHIGSLGAGTLEGMGVDGGRSGGGRVTQRTGYGSDGALLLNHQRGRRVAQIMQVNVRKIVAADKGLEPAGQGAGNRRFAIGFSEHVVIVGPFKLLFCCLFPLVTLKGFQTFHDHGSGFYLAAGLSGFGVAFDVAHAGDILNGLFNGNQKYKDLF